MVVLPSSFLSLFRRHCPSSIRSWWRRKVGKYSIEQGVASMTIWARNFLSSFPPSSPPFASSLFLRTHLLFAKEAQPWRKREKSTSLHASCVALWRQSTYLGTLRSAWGRSRANSKCLEAAASQHVELGGVWLWVRRSLPGTAWTNTPSRRQVCSPPWTLPRDAPQQSPCDRQPCYTQRGFMDKDLWALPQSMRRKPKWVSSKVRLLTGPLDMICWALTHQTSRSVFLLSLMCFGLSFYHKKNKINNLGSKTFSSPWLHFSTLFKSAQGKMFNSKPILDLYFRNRQESYEMRHVRRS